MSAAGKRLDVLLLEVLPPALLLLQLAPLLPLPLFETLQLAVKVVRLRPQILEAAGRSKGGLSQLSGRAFAFRLV